MDETQTQTTPTPTPTQTVECTPSDCNYLFSIRIVSIDFYMAPPIPNMDISYSSFHGEKVNEVPVIRIYGSTPAGQKTCLHVHKALPYLYVPCADIPFQSMSEGDVYTHAISLALEKALKLKGNAAVKRQHVHGCSVVRARRFYGYHASEELFVKIYLYNPHDVSRAAKFLLGGAVFDRSVQPHESHIPYLLQFLIDYNLYGMGLLHLLKIKFRCPLPDSFAFQGSSNDDRAREGADDLDNVPAPSQNPVWTSSTIPGDWRWQCSSESNGSVGEDVHGVKRQSICELEGDAVVEDVINQQYKSYTSLSQTLSDVKMVQSLVPIWEEFEKTEIHGLSIHPDPGRPLAEDVLKCLSCGLDYEMKFEKLFSEPKKILSSSEQNLTLMGSLTSSEDGRKKIKRGFADPIHAGEERCEPFEMEASVSSTSAEEPPQEERMHGSAEVGKDMYFELQLDERRPSQLTKTSEKAADKEALGILKWLASSQAVEHINSDDELAAEVILSPLLPANTMDKVLEKANTDYEIESQRECQDILDSIEDTSEFEDSKDASYAYLRNPADALSKRIIPQVDGSSDLPSSSCSGPAETSSKAHKRRKTKGSVWGSLPFSMNLKELDPECMDSGSFDMDLGGATRNKGHSGANHSANLSNIGENNAGSSMPRAESDISFSGEASILEELSVRDLMRKKRCHRSMPPEVSCLHSTPPKLSRKEDVDVFSYPEDTAFNKSSDDDQKELSNVYKKLPFNSCSHDGSIEDSFQAHLEEHGVLPYAAKFNDESDASGLMADTASREPGIRMTRFLTLENVSLRPLETNRSLFSLDLHEGCREEWPDNDNRLITSVATSDNLIKLERSACLGNNPDDGGTLFACCDAVSYADHEDNEKRNDTKFSQDFNHGDHASEKAAGLSGAAISESTVLVEKALHIVDQSCEKGPLVAHQGEAFRNVPFIEARSNSISPAEERGLDEFPPAFHKGIQEGSGSRNSNVGGDLTVCQESLSDVPTHYLNDGSILYLLKPAISPPTVDSVANWLSLEHEGESGSAVGTPKISLDGADRVIPGSGSSDAKNSIDNVKLDSGDFGAEISSSHGEGTKILSKDNSPKLKPCSNCIRDISQISGPDGKSGSTPLSQLGFRDPASVGAGQQLTMLSIEVQAECRGDLRSDPRFDAINVAALTVVSDIGFGAEHYLLLHCKNENKSNSRSYDGLTSCKVLVFLEEKDLLLHFVKIVSNCDPDILVGWDVQSGSLGFMAERASYLGIGLLNMISRTPCESKIAFRDLEIADKEVNHDAAPEALGENPILKEAIIEDEWGRTHASGIHVGGRIVLNVWRLMRGEIKLTMYTAEAVAESVLRRKIPSIPHKILTKWFSRGPGRERYRCLQYMMERSKINLQIMNQLDMVNRTSELARVFGIDFFSVLSRGSQYRVESMFIRLAHTQNYIVVSPGNQQVASQPAMECLPLVMEPESGFYADPVVVLDFQSLYPSMIIAYNLCFSTCLGKVIPSKENTLGVASFSPDPQVLQNLRDQLLLTPNGVMYVPPKIRKGVLPRLLEEILSTRIIVKQAMKNLTSSQTVLHRIFNARQLALKLIANVTYGYTAAGFSGRMPCAELADSIVQCGRRTLESAISFVNAHDKWNARVIYGDTDSMFVLLKGRTMKEAFQVGKEIASAISAMNPNPVALKMEKVYHPCFLLTKKRYVGYSYESPDQAEPLFDAKGIETVRRDTCNAVAKSMEQSLRLYFECQDTSKVKAYLYRQWTKILSGRVSLQNFIFAKEVRLGTYSTRASSSLPPAAIVATKAMRVDPRAEPRYGERVPYIVVHGQPGARLVDMVVDPLEVLALDSPFRVNELYYITKQIIPALQRVFGLVGADLYRWFREMPRPIRENIAKRPFNGLNPQRKRIDYYYLSKHCIVCGDLVLASAYLCEKCSRKSDAVATVVTGKTAKLEREMQHLAAICQHCGGGDWLLETGVKCTSLACPIFYERRKVQKELQSLSAVATELGLYPKCMVEWF